MTQTETELSKMTASEHARNLNNKTRTWLSEGEGRMAMLLVEDQDFWANMGLVTGLDLARDIAANTISGLYKEQHGIRPRWLDFSKMTLAEMEAKVEELEIGVAY